jgi:hypothetical protein
MNKGKKGKVYFGLLCFYLLYLYLSFFRKIQRAEEEEKDREVQTKKQHITQRFPTMTTLRSTNEYAHLSIPTAYVIE